MDSNIRTIIELLLALNTKEEILAFLNELLTESEITTLSKRWRILSMLAEGRTQRDIVKELHVSLCKVTRGSKILKGEKSVIAKYFMEDLKNGSTNNFKH